MVSHPEVNRRLKEFVCIRLDHDQMQKHRGRLKVPTQGNQVLLDPQGQYVSGLDPRGKRYKVEEFIEILDRVIQEHPPKNDGLRLAWFFWNPKDQGLPGHFGPEFISRLDRKPLLAISGPIPEWLDRTEFLRKHQRQFIWTRGAAEGPARIVVRQFEPQRQELATVELDGTTPEQLSELLDRVWLQYMQQRPMVARGYIDNPHGNWLKNVMEQVHREEVEVRKQAEQGTLLPPGRSTDTAK